jgi:transposase-like protein
MIKNQSEEIEMNESKPRTRYTLEFRLEALKLVKGGQVAAVTAKILGIPKQTLENWVRLANKV